jgi:hypothetical protein
MATDNYYCGEKIIINTKSPRKCPPGLDDRWQTGLLADPSAAQN